MDNWPKVGAIMQMETIKTRFLIGMALESVGFPGLAYVCFDWREDSK